MTANIFLKKTGTILAIASISWLMVACSEPATTTNTSDQTAATQQTAASASALQFQQGKHYRQVDNIDSENAKPPYLVQYFWFGCQHCQQFEPMLEAIMLRRPELSLVRKHAAVLPHWQTDSRIFYSLQQMGHEQLTDPLFKLYEQKRQLTVEDLQQFLASHQVDQASFFDIAENSEQVVSKMRQSTSEMQNNNIPGVPAIVVNGKYLITPNADINNLDAYLALIDHLQKK